MSQESITLSVRLRHASMPLDTISASMGVQPTAMHAAGDSRRTRTGRELGGLHAETYWAFELLQRMDSKLERAIADANAWLVQREGFLHGFSRSGGSIEYYTSVSCNTRFPFELPPDLLGACAGLGVCLSIEIFCS
jgi:hypothetical protein